MSLNNPQVQFVRYKESGQPDRFFVYITTNFAHSNFEADGVTSITGPDSNGLLKVVVKVKTVGLALRLNKPVVHQVELIDVDVTTITDIEVKITEGSTERVVVIVHQDQSETMVKPIGQTPMYS